MKTINPIWLNRPRFAREVAGNSKAPGGGPEQAQYGGPKDYPADDFADNLGLAEFAHDFCAAAGEYDNDQNLKQQNTEWASQIPIKLRTQTAWRYGCNDSWSGKAWLSDRAH